MDDWLSSARDSIADAGGVPQAELSIDEHAARLLLDLARIAAHTSGDRTNAPLLSYLVGVAVAKGGDLDAIAAAIRNLP